MVTVTNYPIRERRNDLLFKMLCKNCGNEIKKGERYYSPKGNETHVNCV